LNYLDKKRGPEDPLEENVIFKSHEVCNLNSSVIAVCVNSKSAETLVKTFCKWISNKTITGLKADLRLEGVLSNGTNHLEGNIWAIEETCVIR
jgi:hypothetical protein